jgi:hypothetical protein
MALWRTIETFLAPADEVLALEEDAAPGDAAGRAEDLHEHVRDRRLPAARLAGEPDDLALVHREVDAVDGARAAGAGAVLDHEPTQLEQRLLARACHDRVVHEARHA